jgi:hypothetical protein
MAININGGFNIRTFWVNEKMFSLMSKIKLGKLMPNVWNSLRRV